MEENQNRDLAYETAVSATRLPSDAEYSKYAVESDHALYALITQQHNSIDPLKTIQAALIFGAKFYQGDWCGILDYDPGTGVWTPLWWYSLDSGWMGDNLFHEYELSVDAPRWVEAYRKFQPVIVEDAESLKTTAPVEYTLYRRLHVHRVIGVPFYGSSTGFIVVRNPRRYPLFFTHLMFLTYAVMTQINLYREMELSKLQDEQAEGVGGNVVRINVFGGLAIHARGYVLTEEQIKSQNFCRVLVFLLCNPEGKYGNRQIDEFLLGESPRVGNSSMTVNAIYRFRKEHGLLTEPYRLIETYHKGYRLNHELEIHTDMDDFDALCSAAEASNVTEQKIELLKKALVLYKGRVFPSGDGEHWLLPTVSYYEEKYMKALNRLMELLDHINDLPCIREHSAQAIAVEPANVDAHYWLIYALCKQGARNLAREELANARTHLIEDDYEDLLHKLKPFHLRSRFE